MAPLASLDLFAGRATGALVGRPREVAALDRSITSARSGVVGLVFEGEPGIGKTRLLLAAEERARAQGFATVAVTADEEIRGPFLLARAIFGAAAAHTSPDTTAAAELQHAVSLLTSRDEPGFEGMPSDQRLLRIFDVAAGALRALAQDRPLALLIDDVQWADDDSLRILRYLVRVDPATPLLLVFAMRPEQRANVTEAVTLLADMDRQRQLFRLHLGRLSQFESTELLQALLGARVHPDTAAIMHAQAEGVPFILTEQAQAYREAGLIQQIDGAWMLARNAQRLLPSAVRTLIQRRAARLPDDTRALLAEAAVLGRRFSLRDLVDVRDRLSGTAHSADDLAARLDAAADLGLLIRHPQGTAADFSFTHEQVRQYAADTLPPAQRRAVHAALVDLLTRDGEALPECMFLLAQHALAAGQAELGAKASVRAARAALDTNAPEEALRLIEVAHPVASSPQDRVALLCLRDDALGMLRRPAQRLESLTELAALAEALGDAHLSMDVALRRAATLRLSDDHDVAATLARRVRAQAADIEDAATELAACMELGQDLLHVELGEASALTHRESDLDGATEAFERAVTLARELADPRSEAAALRELGVIGVSRVREWFVGMMEAGDEGALVRRVAAGEPLDSILPELPIFPIVQEAVARFHRALELYEQLGDRRGTMASIIAMATLSWAPDIHVTGHVQHIEEIRRLSTRMKSMTRESERALAEAQILFGTHVYAQSRGFADVAISKGEEAYASARSFGQRGIEFAAAGSIALQYAQLEMFEHANRWLDRAASVATVDATPLRSRRIELWRGVVQWAAGDAEGMRTHLQRAVDIATEQGELAARCEALARLALASAWLGSEQHDEALLHLAERTARDVQSIAPALPGHPPWGAEAEAALARVALHRGELQVAATHGRAALRFVSEAVREDLLLDMTLPAAEAVIEGGSPEERDALREQLGVELAFIARRISDEHIRSRWFRSRVGRTLTRLAAPLEAGPAAAGHAGPPLSEAEAGLLRQVAAGHTNSDAAAELGLSEEDVAKQLAVLFARLGIASRADATVAAITGRLV